MQNIFDQSKSRSQRLKYNSILFILGIISALAFAPFKWILCIFIGYSGLYILSAYNSFWFFLAQTMLSCHWIFFSIANYGKLPVLPAIFLTVIACCLISIIPAILQGICRNKYKLLFWPMWIVVSELIRSYFLFSGFPWLLLGTSLVHSYAWVWLSIVGVHGASLILATVIACCIESIKYSKLLIIPGIIWAIAPILISGNWTVRQNKPLTFLTKKSQSTREPEIQQLLGSRNNVDFVLWPEGVIHHNINKSEIISAKSKQSKALVIFGGITEHNNNFFNSAIALYPNGKMSEHHKYHLVAFGEYWPMRNLYKNIFHAPIDLARASAKNSKLIPIKNTFILPIICYDVAFSSWMMPEIIQAGILISMHQMRWFNSNFAYEQQLEFAQARSIEYGRAQVFLESNTGHALIQPNGKVVFGVNSIDVYSGLTPYSALLLLLDDIVLKLGLKSIGN